MGQVSVPVRDKSRRASDSGSIYYSKTSLMQRTVVSPLCPVCGNVYE